MNFKPELHGIIFSACMPLTLMVSLRTSSLNPLPVLLCQEAALDEFHYKTDSLHLPLPPPEVHSLWNHIFSPESTSKYYWICTFRNGNYQYFPFMPTVDSSFICLYPHSFFHKWHCYNSGRLSASPSQKTHLFPSQVLSGLILVPLLNWWSPYWGSWISFQEWSHNHYVTVDKRFSILSAHLFTISCYLLAMKEGMKKNHLTVH